MLTTLVLTIIGEDRPGLVEAVSAVVSQHGANWEASHMARLSGRFAGILQVAVDETKAESLAKALGELEPSGLRVIVEDSGKSAPPIGPTLSLELVGADRPKIIHDISQLLARRNVTVLELDSECVAAPMAGGRLFKMNALVRCPADLARKELQDALESLANELMVDIRVHE